MIPTLNRLPVIIDGPGIYLTRCGGRALIHAVKPYVQQPGCLPREEVTAFEAKGAIERILRGKPKFMGHETWHVSGRRLPIEQSMHDIIAKAPPPAPGSDQ